MSDSKTVLARRQLLQMGVGFGMAPVFAGVANAATGIAGQLDLSTSEARFNARIKMIGSLAEETVYVSFSGNIWGILPNREPQIICGFHGLARSNWIPQTDGSIIQESFDIGYFSNPETGLKVDEMINPLTGETIRPFHYKYGGWQQTHSKLQPLYTDHGEKDWTRAGEKILNSEHRSGDFPTPIHPEKWPRETGGEKFFLGTETNYLSSAVQIADENISSADITLFWTSVLSWEPWLLMDSTPGFDMWRAIGRKLKSFEDAPKAMLDHIAEAQPNYFDHGKPWEGGIDTYTSYTEQRTPAS